MPRAAPAWIRRLAAAAGRLARGALARPRVLPHVAGAAVRVMGRTGGPLAVLRDRPRAVTFVMHNFMDATVVAPAWRRWSGAR